MVFSSVWSVCFWDYRLRSSLVSSPVVLVIFIQGYAQEYHDDSSQDYGFKGAEIPTLRHARGYFYNRVYHGVAAALDLLFLDYLIMFSSRNLK